LLNLAGELIKSGLHPSEILKGYEKASQKCLELFESIPKHLVSDIKNPEEITKVIRSSIGSKLSYGQDLILAPLIAQACMSVLPSDPEKFNADNVRVAKFIGGSLIDSHIIKGLVVGRLVEGSITSVGVNIYPNFRNAKLLFTTAQSKPNKLKPRTLFY
jgi:T-complex protein 1 subunit theta